MRDRLCGKSRYNTRLTEKARAGASLRGRERTNGTDQKTPQGTSEDRRVGFSVHMHTDHEYKEEVSAENKGT